MKRVMIVSHAGGSPYHGPNMRSYFVARNLVERGYDVTIISSAFFHKYFTLPRTTGRLTWEVIDGVRYVWVRTRPYKRRNYQQVINQLDFVARTFLKWPVEEAPDFVIASSPHPLVIFFAAAVAKRHGAQLAFEIRDVWPEVIQEIGGIPDLHPYILLLRFAVRYAYRRANHVVTVKPGDGPFLEEHYPACRGKIRFIPNGFDTHNLIEADDGGDLKSFDGKFVVGYVGAISQYYEIRSLLEAALLLQEEDDIVFVLYGGGESVDALREWVAEQGLENVHFEGVIDKKYVLQAVRSFDVCYLGLKSVDMNRNGISTNKLFEYMYAKRPVLACYETDYDIVADAGCGRSVTPGDPEALAAAIRELHALTPDERVALGEAARAYLEEHHTYERIVAKYVDLLESPARQ